MRPRVLLSPDVFRAEEIAVRLRQEGDCEVCFGPPVPARGRLEYSEQDIAQLVAPADAMLCSPREWVTRNVLLAADRLKVVASLIIGTENIDVTAATDLSIVVAYGAVPKNTLDVAEAVVMLASTLLKGLPAKQAALADGIWRPLPLGHMVAGRTIGLVGFGSIGRAVARRLAGWDCRLVATDPFVKTEEAADFGVELVCLERLLQDADVVSLHVTLTEQTRNLISRRELELMRPAAYLINTSRGGVVDETALLDALNSEAIAGAAIDVWQDESVWPDNPLRKHPRVIATGHSVGLSD